MEAISVSQLNLYRACSLKYKFQYIDRLPKPFKPAGLAFGSAIHAAIEWLYKERLQEREATPEDLVKMFSAEWYSQKLGAEIRMKDGDSEEELTEQAKTLLALYQEHGPKNATHVEFPFKVSLVDFSTGEVLDAPLVGYIDLIENNETVDDVKVTARSMDFDSLDTQFQFLAYDYAFFALFKRRPASIKLVNLIKTKNPKMETKELERPERDHRWFFHTAKESIKAIREGVFFPNPSFRCKECEYATQCSVWPTLSEAD